MVRTRHSGDLDAVESPKFLTLDDERDTNKYDTSKRDKCYASSQLRGAYHDDDEYNIFEDKVMNSRLRPRRAYNYLDADSSDDDQTRLHKRQASHMEIQGHFQSSRTMKQEMFEEIEQTTRRKSSRQAEIQNDDDDVSCMIRRRSLRQTRQPSQPRESHSRKHYTGRRSREVIGSDHKDEENEDTENEGTDDEQKDQEDQDDTDNEGRNNFSDMYSRVKRTRLRDKRDIYETDNDQQNRNNNQAEETDEEEERAFTRRSERKAKKKPPEIVKSYSLREHKPRTDLYKAPVEERKIRKNTNNIFEVTPTKKTSSQPYQSPAQRRKTKKRSAIHSSSSSTSSSSGESSDEKSFKKRKAKSMAKARSRMRPMNFNNTDPASGVIKDRVKSGASLADVEPMSIDKNVTFESIGGLGKHIRSLKEMVVFPLLYDKVFQKFNVDPPRGVLFYGPPGTGKTLVARALANECSHGDKRVAFFMRKGADCLSKWVGESERQLRLLFDQAYKYRPSIIFFDEIDGLAPVRSSRQDQIHSSIVSTLLALMDGLDSRGEIVVIGATNRIDSLDPALRRPGRFDREFLFSLPSLEARKQILKIHTDKWNPKLNDLFITELAEKCVGYCGADLKSLCTEATMMALRRRYPQIYMSNDALQLDLTSINVCAKDFFNAMRNIIPTSRRSVNAPGRPLSLQVVPLLARQLDKALTQLSDSFPPCLHKTTTSNNSANATNSEMIWEELPSDEDENAPSIFVTSASKSYKSQQRIEKAGSSKEFNPYLNFTRFSTLQPWTFRPRILLTGVSGQGQTSYIAPAMIHRMEDLPVHVLDLPALYAVTAKTPEESCANVFHEAKRKSPSIIYMPYINQWWGVLGDTLRTTLLTLIQDLDPSTPLLLLATSEQPYSTVDPELQLLFSETSSEVFKMMNPNSEEREHYFKELLLQHSCKAPAEKKGIARKMLEVLPKAVPVAPKELTNREIETLMEKEELTLMELRIFLRDVLHKLGSDKKFSMFTKAVNIEDAPDYYEVIESPMDLSSMMCKIDCHDYGTVRSFVDDIDLICSNALEYNPDRGPMDRVIRHRACALKDTAYAIIKTELDKDFEKMCVEIQESRKRRGIKSTTVPSFVRTKPSSQNAQSTSKNVIPNYLDFTRPPRSIPEPEGQRYSRRVRGLNIDIAATLEDVEKTARVSNASPIKVDQNECAQNSSQMGNTSDGNESATQDMEEDGPDGANDSIDSAKSFEPKCHTDPVKKSIRKNKCVWCRPSRKRRKLFQTRFLPSITKKLMQRAVTQAGKKEKGIKSSHSPSVDQPLKIDVIAPSESEDLKSPVRKSSRLVSPSMSTGGVTTRRQSLSPRIAEIVDVPPKDPPPQEKAIPEKDETVAPSVAEKPQSEKDKEQSGVSNFLEKTAESLKEIESQPDSKKAAAVKRLDLDFVAVDSGAGSSLDGNGDSRDSMDKLEEAATSVKPTHQVKDFNQNNERYLPEKAGAVLNESQPKLIVSAERLSKLLARLVQGTEGCNVEHLEKIYSQLSQIIYKHRQAYDRTEMMTELERKVTDMTRKPSGASSFR